MAQAGIHALVGAAFCKVTRKREGLLLGVILGNLIPDLDNIAVAVATLMGKSTEGLHRTFTHSIFTVLGIWLVFYVVKLATNDDNAWNLGFGLGIGVLMHVLLDLVVWFNGVEILWPLPSWVNFWEGVTPPDWWMKLMMPVEFLFMGGFLLLLNSWALRTNTNLDYLPRLRVIMYVLLVFFVIFTVLVYVMKSGFMIPYGALYLIALGTIAGVTIRMRETIKHS